jgi:hypothetical protein
MKIWWTLQCDMNHEWTLDLPEGEEISDGADQCPVDGLPAVTAVPERPADRVAVTLRPAARVVDRVTGQVGRDSEYFLEISSRDGRDSRQSAKVFSWDEAVRRAAVFQKATWEQAARRWARMGLDKL